MEMRAFLLLGFLARWGKEELYCSILSVRWEPKGRGGAAFTLDASQPWRGLAQRLQSQRVQLGSSSQSTDARAQPLQWQERQQPERTHEASYEAASSCGQTTHGSLSPSEPVAPWSRRARQSSAPGALP
jgi:hypothetical protein